MPNFIGRDIKMTEQIHDDAESVPGRPDMVRVTYTQASRLPVEAVCKSVDTSDRGGPRVKAKRWYRWFAAAQAVLDCPTSTSNMRLRALQGQLAQHRTDLARQHGEEGK